MLRFPSLIAMAMVLGSIFLFRAAAYSSAFFTQFGLIFAGMLAGVGGIYMNGGFGVASIVIITVIAFFIHTTIEAIRKEKDTRGADFFTKRKVTPKTVDRYFQFPVFLVGVLFLFFENRIIARGDLVGMSILAGGLIIGYVVIKPLVRAYEKS
ncbi:MAG: hypothetical protein ACLFUS_14445 [Candidatus Sumerlaeia bacterium]